MMDYASMRKDYSGRSLDRQGAGTDPIGLFGNWFQEAVEAEREQGREANAMTLATADVEGKPSARIVLLKHFDPDGFVFFTNYDGRKARELAANPWAAAVLHWPSLERQVRIEGRAERTSEAESDEYFASRPRFSQLAAAASPQSHEVASRQVLEERLRALDERHRGAPLPRPSGWGGFRIRAQTIEFWQGRPGRLHDRLEFRVDRTGTWTVRRLAP